MDLSAQKVPKWIKMVKKTSVSSKPHQLITRGQQLVWGFRGHWNNQEVKACRPVLNVTWSAWMFGVPDRWLRRYSLLKTEAFDSFSIEEGIVSLPLTCMLLTTWHRRLTDSFSSLTRRSRSYSREAVGFNTHLCCSHTIWRKVRRKTLCDGGKIRFLSFYHCTAPNFLWHPQEQRSHVESVFRTLQARHCLSNHLPSRCLPQHWAEPRVMSLLGVSVFFFFFFLRGGSIYNELWVISGHPQWSHLGYLIRLCSFKCQRERMELYKLLF